MDPNRTAIERAFELARTGRFATCQAVKTALSTEGYSVAQITGKTLLKQLRELIRSTRTPA